ncbi:Fructose-2,6-bisphosphatase TIGAR [Folsomia candida]|uniref:Fructose-2,6-bisphosphatase TIGAR n=1 Tax=Folsomia candida TaxID=158441 RepID=A0A226F7T4_FOLCA|nr:Fructose-2,6-bisphosphatase TIGAR [Folsomia candida]
MIGEPNVAHIIGSTQKINFVLYFYLSKENITRVYSSDYLRALRTAEAIVKGSKNLTKLQIKTDVRLRERAVGVFQGKKYQDAITALLKSGGDLMGFTPQGAEKMKDVGCRMSNFFKELCTELDNGDEEQEVVVVVSHSFALIKLIDTLIKSKSYRVVHWDHSKGYKLIRNGSFIKLSLGLLKDNCEDLSTLPGQRRIEFLNLHETEHLQGLVENDTLVKFTQCTDEGKAFSGCIQS